MTSPSRAGGAIIPGYIPPSPLAVRHHRQSFDRKSQTSTSQRYDTHIGSAHAIQDANVAALLSSPSPISAQSTVTTTTVITTTITTNMTSHPGNQWQGVQPWVTTATRTDVQETSSVSHHSDLFAASSCPIGADVMEASHVLMPPPFHAIEAPKSPEQLRERRNVGFRRSYGAANSSPPSPSSTGRSSISKSRRTSAPPTTDAAAAREMHQGSRIDATIAPLPTLHSQRHTPTTLLRLSSAPRSSDLILIRLLAPLHYHNIPEAFEEGYTGEFLAAIDPKRNATAAGEILISPIPLPTALANCPLEECRIVFQWLSGERVQATYTSECLGGTHLPPPASKRPKLE